MSDSPAEVTAAVVKKPTVVTWCWKHASNLTAERCDYALYKGYDGPPNDCKGVEVRLVPVESPGG